MVFKNEKQIERFLLEKSRLALIKAQDRVYSIIKRFLYRFYLEYDPSESEYGYERTRQLLESLVQSRIVSDGNGYKAEIYFDVDGLNYVTGGQPTGEQVMAAATQGYHGAIGEIPNSDKEFKYVDIGNGTKIWDDPIQKLNAEAIDILVEMLKSEGVPVKKGR